MHQSCATGAFVAARCWDLLRLSALVFGFATCGVAPSNAQSGSGSGSGAAAMVILDGSGSMWGRAGSSNKITVARDALLSTLPDFAGAFDLGLVAYGHNRKSDCQDIETLAALQPIPGDGFQQELRRFSPRGKTPISTALELAVEQLPPDASRQDVILLTDGAENCRRDPCGVVDQLRAERPALRFHVLALSLKPKDLDDTRCIAERGGGELVIAETESELAAGLNDILSQIGSGRSQRRLAATVPAEDLPPSLEVWAVLNEGGPPLHDDLSWRIVRTDGADPETVIYEGPAPPNSIDLEAGKYRADVELGLVRRSQEIEVAGNGPTRVAINLNAGRLAAVARGERAGAALDNTSYSIFSASEGATRSRVVAVSRDREPQFILPAGDYRIVAQQGLARVERTVSIGAGSNVDAELLIYAGELLLTAVSVPGGAPLEHVVFTVLEDDPTSPDGLRVVVRSAATRPVFSLPAGVYHVQARRGAVSVRDRVTVQPARQQLHESVLNAARLRLTATLAGTKTPLPQNVTFEVQRLNTAGEPAGRLIQRRGATAEIDLGAARYRVAARLGTANAQSAGEIEMRPGREADVQLHIPAGIIRPLLNPTRRGDIFWQVFDETGDEIHITGAVAPSIPLAAGRYRIVAHNQGQLYDAVVEVTPGEDRAVEIPASQ